MRYEVEVTETRDVPMLYVVDADSEAEAIAKAERGETASEHETGSGGVSDRMAHEARVI